MIGGNPLRRTRGGQQQLTKHLWPRLDLIVSFDVRMTTTGRWSDIVLPSAQHYENPNVPSKTPDGMKLTLSDRGPPRPPDRVILARCEAPSPCCVDETLGCSSSVGAFRSSATPWPRWHLPSPYCI
jgi:hypothetical protein